MRLFIGEFVCGGGLAATREDEIPAGLWREGGAMLDAVIQDALGLENVTPVVPVDARWSPPQVYHERCELKPLPMTAGWAYHWQRYAADCDAVLAIAPEDGPLRIIYDALSDAGPYWLGCRAEALDAGINKRILAELLNEAGIRTPGTLTAEEVNAGLALESNRGWVTKPVDGCGSQGIRLLNQWSDVLSDLRTKSTSYRIVQPKLAGRSASCSVLCGSSDYLALPPMWQTLDPTNFQYLGGEGPLEKSLAVRAQTIALAAVKALGAGAGGYIGVDLLLGEAEDGSDDAVIEVNPRLTTSYVGLRHLVSENLLGMLLKLSKGESVAYRVNARKLKFDGNGLVTEL